MRGSPIGGRECIQIAVTLFLGSDSLLAAPAIQWTRNFGGNQRDIAEVFVADTAQGKFYVLGQREYPSHFNAQIVCWNETGDLLWSRSGGASNADEIFRLATVTSSGGIIAAEQWLAPLPDPDSSGYRIIRFSSTGDTTWIQNFWETYPDPSFPNSLTARTDGGFYVASNMYQGGLILTEATESGDTVWSRYSSGSRFLPFGLVERDTDLVVFARRDIVDGGGAVLLEFVLPPPFLDFIWITEMPYVPGTKGFALHPSGDYYYAGLFNSYPDSSGYEGEVVKTGAFGNLKWSRVLGGHYNDEFVNVIPTIDGNIAAVGVKNYDIWLVKFDTSGAVLWDTTYTLGNEDVWETPVGLAQLSDGSFIIGGDADVVSFGNPDFFLLRTEPDVPMALPEVNGILPVEFSLQQNYPNPFNASTQIEFELSQTAPVKLAIFDVTGREVETLVNSTLTAGRYRYYFYANELASGVYFYRLQAGATIETKKLMLLR